MADESQLLSEVIQQAYLRKSPVNIRGHQSKSFLRLVDEGEALSTLAHTGIVDYEPAELVMTVRSGTTLTTIEAVLHESGQMMAFEPPVFGGGTIGGAVACGLSGPRRPWSGAIRDFVLGTRVINGKGENLRFGGQVMKNVAGYDVSRLMAGAYGVLGLIVEVSMKVLPLPERETTQVFEISPQDAIDYMAKLGNSTIPLSAACWYRNKLMIRLSGTESGVNAAVKKLGGETHPESGHFWQCIRDHEHTFFKAGNYWRFSLPPATINLQFKDSDTEQLIDWGGAQRWVRTTDAGPDIQQLANQHHGYAEQFHSSEKQFLRAPLSNGIYQIHANLKKAFDPAGILNPGCFYPGI